jgi:superfamily II DNA or RNA helicase
MVSQSYELPQAERLHFAGAIQGVLNRWENPAHPFSFDEPQIDALTSIGQSIMNGIDSGYVHMPTGSGKTVLESVLAEAGVRAGRRVMLLAPSTTIASQIAGRNRSSGIGKFTELYDRTTVGEHFGMRRSNNNAQVVISTYSGFLNDAARGYARLGQFGCIIGDECHRSLGAKTSQLLTEAYPGAIKLGFSATPPLLQRSPVR